MDAVTSYGGYTSYASLKKKRILIAMVLLFTLVGVGSIGFHFIEGWTWFESLYGTLMTVTTIGAEPENQLSGRGRAFNILSDSAWSASPLVPSPTR